jgi:hypothetical protein
VAIALAALTLSACSSEDLAERVAEEAIERQLEADGQTGGVDVDLGDGEFRVDTPDGSMVVNVDEDGEGNVSISGQGGDGDVQMEFGEEDGVTVISTPEGEMVIGSGELPDDFPAAVPVPTGLTVQSATSMDGADGTAYVISGTVGGDFLEATQAYTAALEAAGFTRQSITESTDGTFFGFVNADWNVSGGIFPDGTGGGGSQVNINVFAATG